MKNTSYTDSFKAVSGHIGHAVQTDRTGLPLIKMFLDPKNETTKGVKRLKLGSKKSKDAIVSILKELSSHTQHDLIERLFDNDSDFILTTLENVKIMIHFSGDERTNISDEVFGTFWAYIKWRGQCRSNKMEVARFIQAFFSSRGDFKGLYRFLCGEQSRNTLIFKQNPLVQAYEMLLNNKVINRITYKKVVSQ